MKRIIALCLTIVMLLGMVSMVASAEEVKYFTGVSLALRESIAISFKADEAAIKNTFTKVEFVKNGNVVQTIDTLPAANDEGKVAFACTKIAPSEMGTDITAKLYLGETVADELTASVYDYCAAVLADANADAKLKTLVVDMLQYGAATQTYINDTNSLITDKLNDDQIALGTPDNAAIALENKAVLGAAPAGASVTWTAAALSLRESVAISYKFTAASVDGLSVALACGDSSWTVNSFKDEGNGVYSFRFTGLNPAMMRDAVTAVVMNGETAVSSELTYSIESYAAQVVADTDADAKLVELVKAMMRYGDAAAAYVEGDPAHRYDENGRCVVCATAHFTAGKNVCIQAEEANLMTTVDSTVSGSTDSPVKVYKLTETGCGIRENGNVVKMFVENRSAQAADAPAHLSFDVTPEEDGAYSIWVKYYVGSDSNFYLKVEGVDTTWKTVNITGTGFVANQNANYGWIKLSTATWEAGETYTVGLRSRRNVPFIDEFIVTKDATFDPTHTHTYEWEYTDLQHWQKATCCDDVTTEKVAHSYTAGVCECGHMQTTTMKVTIQAEEANLMTTPDSTAGNKTDSPVKVYKITETGCGIREDGNVVKMFIENRISQPDDAPAHLSFDITPNANGEYAIWMKYYLQGTANTNVFLKVEGEHTKWVQTDVGPGTGFVPNQNANYGWIKLSTADWEAGETYTVGLRSRRYVLFMDEFVVTNDISYNPAIVPPVQGPNELPIG